MKKHILRKYNTIVPVWYFSMDAFYILNDYKIFSRKSRVLVLKISSTTGNYGSMQRMPQNMKAWAHPQVRSKVALLPQYRILSFSRM